MNKRILGILILTMSVGLHAQISKGLDISISSGITSPTGDYKTMTQADEQMDLAGAETIQLYGFTKERSGKNQFNMDVSYQFGGLGAGISLGSFKHEITSLKYNLSFPTLLKGGDVKGTYYGLGPNYGFSFGKFKMISMLRAGMMNLDITDFSGSYNGDDSDIPVEILQTQLGQEAKQTLPYSSFGFQFTYPLSSHFSLFSKLDYFTSFGNGIEVNDTYYLPFDVDRDQTITATDVGHFTLIDYRKETHRNLKPQMFNVGVGIQYTIAGKPKKTRPAKADKPILFQEKPDTKEPENRQIVLTAPENGAQFGDQRKLKDFEWKVVGKPFKNPTYIIEVSAVNNRGRSFVGKSSKTSITAKEIFKDNKPSGQYTWRVVEQNSGESSGNATFFYTDCDVQLTLDNTEIECLGYEGEDRKYKICFDVTYSSSVGDLTFANAGSGLMVYDQNYTALNYNLTGSNTTLQTQTGAPQSTVHYCFETLVDSNVSSIGFGLQGDDLDPSPLICQPGASSGIDDLPDCLCDECDAITIDVSNFNISQQSPGVYTFDGNVQVNVPVYGIAFQLVSYNYSSNPNACSNGVSSVETSGMFLQAGTTINNSSSIQFINESASQSPASNTNASKDIVYTASSAMNGSIPVHLNIGLPKPLQGLDAGCCQIDYEVCLKIKVFYEDGSCKTCYTTQCFNFNNQ